VENRERRRASQSAVAHARSVHGQGRLEPGSVARNEMVCVILRRGRDGAVSAATRKRDKEDGKSERAWRSNSPTISARHGVAFQ
jgi:hypothetical protein